MSLPVPTRLRLLGCVVELDRRHVQCDDGTSATLTTKEAELLGYLGARPGEDVPRGALLEAVWGYRPTTRTRTLDTTVKTLRKKIERDPAAPEHVITVHGTGYRFVPAAAPATHERLPSERGPFVGRAEAVAVLRAHLAGEGPAVAVITGPGGAGKSRLALHAVSRHATGAARWIEVPASTSVQVVRAALAAGLDGPGEPEALARHLAGLGPVAVVLDDVEVARDAIGDILPGLVQAAPAVRWVLTSRVGLAGPWRRVPLEGLTAAEGTSLLLELLQRRALPLDGPLTEVVARLEGLPLALELVAARLGLLTPAQLLEQLDASPLDLVARRGDDRRSSLRRVVAWSWQLLDEAARGHLAALSTFRADWNLEAAGAVLELEPLPLLDVLDTLTEASLVRLVDAGPLPERRFRLWDTVREFAAEQVTPSVAVLRHARWLAEASPTWSQQAVGPDGGVARARLRRAMADTLALPARVRDRDPGLAARVAIGGLLPLQLGGAHDVAAGLLAAAVADARVAGDRTLEVQARIRRTHLARALGRLDEAAVEAESLATEGLEVSLQGEVWRARGVVHLARGRFAEAVAALALAEARLREGGDPRGAALALGDRGTALAHGPDADLAAAITCTEAAVDVLARHGGPIDRCLFLANLASWLRRQGRTEASEARATEALREARLARYLSVEGQALAILALLAADRGELERGEELFAQASDLLEGCAAPGLAAQVRQARAQLAERRGDG